MIDEGRDGNFNWKARGIGDVVIAASRNYNKWSIKLNLLLLVISRNREMEINKEMKMKKKQSQLPNESKCSPILLICCNNYTNRSEWFSCGTVQ